MSHKVLFPNASIISNTSQLITDITAAKEITFDVDQVSNQVGTDPGDDTKIVTQVAGIYLAVYTLNVNLISGTNATLDTWVRVNGADVTNSNRKIFMRTAGNNQTTMVAFLGALQKGDFSQVLMRGDTTNLQIQAVAAGAVPTRPKTPSVSITVVKVSELFP